MLSIGRLGANPDPAAYYVEVIASGAEDYYLSAEEAPGRWTGKGAAQIGLTGPVAAEDLRAVLEGDNPRSGEHLVGWRKRPGYDLTLSAPKSVCPLGARRPVDC